MGVNVQSAAAHTLITVIDDALSAAVATIEPPSLRSVILHGMEGGKRVRPALTLLACEASGGSSQDAIVPAVAVELLHTASLFHDDIMDESGMRRGRPSVHARYGVPAAILAGDALLALAFRLMNRTGSDCQPEMLRVFSESFLAVCEGQGYDLAFTGSLGVPGALHREMVEKKTARLLEACTTLGALAATHDRLIISRLASYGRWIGMAFQAQDDLLDATAHSHDLGKPAGHDARKGKQTFLTMAHPVPDTAGEVERLVTEYTDAACRSLEGLPQSAAREQLLFQASSLSHRGR